MAEQEQNPKISFFRGVAPEKTLKHAFETFVTHEFPDVELTTPLGEYLESAFFHGIFFHVFFHSKTDKQPNEIRCVITVAFLTELQEKLKKLKAGKDKNASDTK